MVFRVTGVLFRVAGMAAASQPSYVIASTDVRRLEIGRVLSNFLEPSEFARGSLFEDQGVQV